MTKNIKKFVPLLATVVLFSACSNTKPNTTNFKLGNSEKIEANLILLCEQNDAKACFELGNFYLTKNKVLANTYFELRNKFNIPKCQNGDALACQSLAEAYQYAEGTKKDINLSNYYFQLNFKINKEKCQNGDAEACFKLAHSYKYGINIQKNEKLAKKYFIIENKINEEKCQNGDSLACDSLGINYLNAYGVKKNPALAHKYFDLAKKFAYKNFKDVKEQEHNNSLNLSKEKILKCQNGDAMICAGLANYYFYSDNSKNLNLSKKYFSKSCELGYKEACEQLKLLKQN